MLKKYRKGFVAAYMASIGIVLAVVFTAVGITMHRNDYAELRNTMRHVLMQMERDDRDAEAPPNLPPREVSSDTAYMEPPDRPIPVDADSILAVSMDKETEEITISGEQEDLDSETVFAAVKEIVRSTSEYGKLKRYGLIYYQESAPDRYRIAIAALSYIGQKDAVHFLMLAGMFLASMAVFWIVSVRLSRLAAKPMERAMRMERQFVADISHDLKTPITVILANNNILRNDPQLSVEEQMQWIDSTDAVAQNMMQMVQQMLTLSELESVTQNVQTEPIDLSSAAEKCLLQMEGLAFDQHIFLQDDIEPNLYGYATSEYAERICTGLLENALKYEPNGGTVELALHRDKNAVVLKVRNRGSHIEPEDLPHIFERFYRGDKTRNIREGHGLGLPILHQIAALICAEMDVKSSESEGTTFMVRFRAAETA